MKVVVDRGALVRMLTIVRPERRSGQGDKYAKLSACAGRLFVEAGDVTAGVEALVLEEFRASEPRVKYLVGMPKGRLTKLEAALAEREWQQVRPSLRVKLLPQDGELYVLAHSAARAGKSLS